MRDRIPDSRRRGDRKSRQGGRKKPGLSGILLSLLLAAALLLSACGSGTGTNGSGRTAGEQTADGQAAESGPAAADTADEAADDAAPDSETYRALARKHQQQEDGAEELEMTAEDLPAAAKDFTVMIYMIGSDLESRFGAGSRDLREIMEAGVDYDRTNVIVCAGGTQKWNSGIPCSSNSVLDMSRTGEEDWIVAETEGNSDMGHPATLVSFVNFCTDNYPADQYVLLFWNHGAGPVWGYGSDELFDEDSLLLEEMREAMEQTVFAGQQKLALVGFDACLMGCLENARLWSSYAAYMTASEELEPGDGWDYHFLSVLNGMAGGDAPGHVLGKQILESYQAFNENARSATFSPDITLALVDLSKIDPLIEAVDGLAVKMEEQLSAGEFAGLSRLRRESRAFGLTAVKSRTNGFDLIDLQSLSREMDEKSPAESEAVRTALADAVISHVTNVEGTGGLSLYFPGENMELYKAAEGTLSGSGAVSETYDHFIRSYAERWTASSKTDWTLADPVDSKEDQDSISVQLTQDQLDNLADASYSVMYKADKGTYYMAASGLPLQADGEGRLNIPADPPLIGMEDKSGSTGKPWPFSAVDSRDGVLTMCSTDMILNRSSDSLSSDMIQHVTMTITLQDGRIRIQSVSAEEQGAAAGGKSTVDLSEYDTIAHSYVMGIFPTRRQDGTMLPWENWQNGYTSSKYEIPLEDHVAFSVIPASSFGADCLIQVQVMDVNGQKHVTELYEMSGQGTGKTAEIVNPAGSGIFTVALYGDHAAVTDYEGEDARIEIPSEAEGLPVTAIGTKALYDQWSVEEAVIPEGITAIGSGAFERCVHMRTIRLPRTLTDLSPDAFYECRDLTAFAMEEASDRYQVRDGVLFTGDGTGLICWPWAKGTDCVVPEGTVYIGKRAFFGSPLEHVDLPEGLRELQALAFGECVHLQEVILPESLERIGTMAFGGNKDTDKEACPDIDSVRIGPAVTYIGPEAFSALKKLGRIEVDSRNPAYSAVDGYLTNKAEDTIQEAPRSKDTGSVTVPEGIGGLEPSVFAEFDKYSEFFLPASLTRIPDNLFPKDVLAEGSEYSIVLHCPEGSEAAAYADTKEIPYDSYQSAHEDVTVEGEMGTFYFRLYDSYAALLLYKGIEREVTVPETVEGRPVTILGDGMKCFLKYDTDLEKEIFGEYDTEAYNQAIREGKTPVEASEAAYANCPYGRDTYSKKRELGVDRPEVLHLPDTLTTIRKGAFSDLYHPARFTVPASVTEIEEGAFSEYNGTAIDVEEGSASFKSVSGLLYSADQSLLLAIPSNLTLNGTEGLEEILEQEEAGGKNLFIYHIRIPEGTVRIGAEAAAFLWANDSVGYVLTCPDSLREIGKKAFYNADLVKVELNDGLTRIGASAFERTDMTHLTLPDSVEKIEKFAFNGIRGLDRLELPSSMEEITFSSFGLQDPEQGEPVPHCTEVLLGAKIEKIDNGAFYYLPIDNYTISKRNHQYSVTDGMLLSADGTRLLSCPSGRSGSVTVPDGVTELAQSSFFHCDDVTDVYLPDSVININPQAFKRTISDYGITLHCKPGSYAREAAERMGIDYAD